MIRVHHKTLYFADSGKKHKLRMRIRVLTHSIDPSIATHGSVTEVVRKITIPDGLMFHAFCYWGDLDGWRKSMETVAKTLGLLYAWIERDQSAPSVYNSEYLPKTDKKYLDNNKFVLSDGRSFMLSECKIEPY
jgi:hypothetical protein